MRTKCYSVAYAENEGGVKIFAGGVPLAINRAAGSGDFSASLRKMQYNGRTKQNGARPARGHPFFRLMILSGSDELSSFIQFHQEKSES
jgi:hypothetical protein